MSRRPNQSVQAARRSQSRRPTLEMLEVRELLTGYTVTTVADNGDNNNPTTGSLRAAIIAANNDPTFGADSINFNIAGGGVQTIAVSSALPAITRTVVISATSSPTNTPLVVIDGSGAGAGASGLTFSSGNGSFVRGLSIVGFATNGGVGGAAIDLQSGSGNETIEDDYLGIEPDGATAKANYYGVQVASSNNTIGGSIATNRNVISGNTQAGINLIGGATANVVIGNLIGTDAAGANPVGNLYGVELAASGNTIGGTTSGTGNVISGNGDSQGLNGIGVLFDPQATSDVVEGNMIGTDVTGTTEVYNAYGVYFGTPGASLNNVMGDTIGGTVAGAGNLISGNGYGITGNVTAALIAGNTIGLNVNSNGPLPNADGILLGANYSTIGGSTAAARNVISGNGSSAAGFGLGVNLTGAGDLITGNYIGLTSSGVGGTGIGNSVGLALHVTGSTIGGTSAGAGNVISGNSSDAIEIDSFTGNSIIGNVIGLTALGASLPNAGNGIALTIAAPGTTPTTPLALNDTIGGTTAGAGNTIANSGGAGIVVNDSYQTGITGLSIRGNSIFNNAKLGIDLNASGVPVPSSLFITAAGPINGQLELVGWFFGAPSTSYSVDLFANGADSSGYGQGQVYLGSVTATTNISGYAMITPAFALPATPYTSFSATVTGSNQNTSEFTASYPAISTAAQTDLTIVAQSSASTVVAGNSVTFTETVINNGPGTASNVTLADTLPISFVNATVTTTAGNASIDSNNVVTANLGSLASGQSVTVTITVDASSAGTFTDNPGVGSTTLDPNYGNNQASQSITVQPAGSGPVSDLGISEFSSSATGKVGTNLTYVVTVTNNGPNIATNVVINDFLPASGITLVSAIPSQGSVATINGNLLTENLGSIPINGSATFIITLKPTTAGSITNSANVSGNQFDPVSGNNATTLTTTIASAIPKINLNVSQTSSATTGLVGQNQVFTFTITNNGTDAATNVMFVDLLPTQIFNFVSATPSQGGAAALVGHELVDNLGTIAAGKSATFTLIVAPTTTGPFTNGGYSYSPDVPSATIAFANNVIVSIPSGPSVIGIVGHNNNSSLTLTFDEPLNQANATIKANYKLVALGKSGRGPARTVKIAAAVYDATNHSVTIVPSSKLDPKQFYQIQVIGATRTGVADIYGRRLVNPQYSTPGANFSAVFFAGTFPQS